MTRPGVLETLCCQRFFSMTAEHFIQECLQINKDRRDN